MNKGYRNHKNLLWLRDRNGNGETIPIPPEDAPTEEFMHWIDFSDNDRLNIDVADIDQAAYEKIPFDTGNSYYGGSILPPITGSSINGLQVGNFQGATTNFLQLIGGAPVEFSFPSMTWFILCQPKVVVNQAGFLISDYGDVANKVVYVKIANGTTLVPQAYMRDGGGDSIAVNYGSALSLNTTYLIVARLDGANKTVDLWVDGVGKVTGSNVDYDPTTTWDAEWEANAVPMIGALSGRTQPFQGFIGEAYGAKIAMTEQAINERAQFIAQKWGTTWTDVEE